MKSIIIVLMSTFLLAGCSGLVVDSAQNEDGCVLWDSVRDRSGLAGGPEVQQLITRVKKEGDCFESYVYSRDTHQGVGTAQEAAGTILGGGVGILIQREQKPLSTHDGDITTVNQGGSAASASQADARARQGMNSGDSDDVFCYEDCQQ